MTPALQVPIPGGPELVILLLVVLLPLALLAALAGVAVLAYWLRAGDGVDENEVAELRARVARLEDELAAEREGADEHD